MPTYAAPIPLELDFAWNELNCFLRPQSMLCDGIGRGHGLAFLLLHSLYRGAHCDGYFLDPGKHHFAFTANVFGAFSKIDFNVTRIARRADILPVLLAELERGLPLLVPANIRLLPYFEHYQREDRVHYFIVTGFDRETRSFHIIDNVHATGAITHPTYSPFHLSYDVFETVIQLYWDTHVANGDVLHGEKCHWVLRIQPGPRFEPEAELSVLKRLAAECNRLVRAKPTGDTLLRADRQYLPALRAAHASGATQSLDRLIQTYLKESNVAAVHVKIAIHALDCLGSPVAAALAEEFEDYRRTSHLLRTKLLVRCFSPGPGVEATEWDDVQAEMTRRAKRLVRNLIVAAASVASDPMASDPSGTPATKAVTP